MSLAEGKGITELATKITRLVPLHFFCVATCRASYTRTRSANWPHLRYQITAAFVTVNNLRVEDHAATAFGDSLTSVVNKMARTWRVPYKMAHFPMFPRKWDTLYIRHLICEAKLHTYTKLWIKLKTFTFQFHVLQTADRKEKILY